MKQTCLECERTAPDRNLYCQDVRCRAELSPLILDYGEWLSDIEIIKPIIVQPSSVLYEARRQRQKLLLKVAHPGPAHTERLKREAEFLRGCQQRRAVCPQLPVLLPPYTEGSIVSDPYGRAMLREHLLYFCVFQHAQGEPLRDVLKKHPQLWINHAGWITLGLATAVAELHREGKLHLSLSPHSALVRFDERSNVPQVLLFDLGLLHDAGQPPSHAAAVLSPPAYTAPELLDRRAAPPSYAADVYGLGLLLYELLVGRPPFPTLLRSREAIYEAIRQRMIEPINRRGDVAPIVDITEKAVAQAPGARHQSAKDLAEELRAKFRDIPQARRSRWPSLQTAMLIVVVLLALAFVVALAASLGGSTV